ncbi:DUF1080 domain-containing protein [Panacibacter sp. DH6]|uniref:DUF1080 domain-containing protein n=1 Tax=Panacibacter microcysteis TaxID=2793269 RepID=A0A931GZQ1_9BACT|nr:DUF1080 domain-containing protein [Panacibacter microcysteis]MBG9378273.1 DUF1080 domain-containing protein [Panacibacter microcysteis]
MYKILCCLPAVLFLLNACTPKQEINADASKEEWTNLFNGKDFDGWDIKIAGYNLNDNIHNTFTVKDSMIVVDYSGYDKFTTEFGHMYYKTPYTYYKVRLQYQFYGEQLQGGPGYARLNSGIMLHSQAAATLGKDQSFPVSLEMQFLASDSANKVHTGNLCTPGTLVSMNGKPADLHCIDSHSPYYYENDWINAEADVYGDSVIHHIVNGDTVLTYEKPVIAGDFVNHDFNFTSGGFAADSVKWIEQKDKPLTTGYFALQAESHPIRFRKIELLNLEGCMDKKALNYKSYYIKADNTTCRYK